MRILHILRNPNDTTPIEIATAQSVEHDVALLLLHDAVYLETGLKAFACAADTEARGITAYECVGYERTVQMLFEYDRVVSW